MGSLATKAIPLTGAENIIQAAGYANQIGVPLNRHLTISWDVAGMPGRVQDAQLEVLQLASKWLSYHGVTPAYVWAIENSPTLHYHSHIMIHVPDGMTRKFRTMVDRWVKCVGGDPRTRGAIRMTRDKYKRENYHQSIRHLLRYVLKGIDLKAAQLLGIEPNYEKAGNVMGKRCGASQNLGPAARKQHIADRLPC
jgi:hypothetical protein